MSSSTTDNVEDIVTKCKGCGQEDVFPTETDDLKVGDTHEGYECQVTENCDCRYMTIVKIGNEEVVN